MQKFTQVNTHKYTHIQAHTLAIHSGPLVGNSFWVLTQYNIWYCTHNAALCFIMRYLLWKAASSEFHLNFARQGSPPTPPPLAPTPPPCLLGKNIIYNLHLCISPALLIETFCLHPPSSCCCFVVYTLPETVKRNKEERGSWGRGEGRLYRKRFCARCSAALVSLGHAS